MEIIRPILNIGRDKTRSLFAKYLINKQSINYVKSYFSTITFTETVHPPGKLKDMKKRSSLPKKVLILHLPPKSKVEGLNINQLESSKLAQSAAIIPVDGFKNKEIKKNISNGHIATTNLSDLKSKRVILMPIAVCDHKTEVDLAQSEEKEAPSSLLKKRFNYKDVQTLLTKNMISKSNQSYNSDKISISALEVETKVNIPDIKELVTNSIQKKLNTNSRDQSVQEVKPEHQANPSNDEAYPKGILALDFDATVKGALNLNLGDFNGLKSQGFNNLLATVTANVVGDAIARSCSQIKGKSADLNHASPALNEKGIMGAISIPTSQSEIKPIREFNNSENLAENQSPSSKSDEIEPVERKLEMLSSVENNNDITRITFKKRTIVGELEEYQQLMHSNLLSSIHKKIKASEVKDMFQRRKCYLICLNDEICKAKEKSVSKMDTKTESKPDCLNVAKGSNKKESVCKTVVTPESQVSKSSEKKDTRKLDNCADVAPDSKLDWSKFFKGSDKNDKETIDEKLLETNKQPKMENKSKIDCTRFSKGSEIFSSKTQEKQDSKINCGQISKGPEKTLENSSKETPKKKELKIDCARFSKGPEKKNPETSSKIQEKQDSKINCGQISKSCEKKTFENSSKETPKKNELIINCRQIPKGPEKKKIIESSTCKTAQGKINSEINCAQFSKAPEKKSPESVCSKIQEKPKSKINCDQFAKVSEKKDKSMPDKKTTIKSQTDENCDRSVQTIKIFLSKDVYIEIINAPISKDIINQVQNLLCSSSNSRINSSPTDINKFVTVEIEGPVNIQVKNEKKPDCKPVSTDVRTPFKDGDKKCFSSAAYNLYEPNTNNNSNVVKARVENRLDSGRAPYINHFKSFYPRSEELALVAMSCPARQQQKLGCKKTQDTKLNTVVKVFDRKQLCLGKVPMPEVGDCDVLLKVHSVGISGSDLHVYETGEKSLLNLGQEATGVVEQVGKYVKNVKIGDRVTVESGVPCEVCEYCRDGKYNLCSEIFFNGFLGKYSVHPADFCHKLPKEIMFEDGVLVPVIAQALQACYSARISAKSNVVVMGSCPLALSIVLCARAMGAANICIVGSIKKNLCLAKSFNVDNMILINDCMNACEIADVILKVHGKEKTPSVVINCAADTKALNVATMVLKPGGTCLLAGIQSECACVNVFEMFRKEIAVTSSFGSVNMFPLAIKLLSSCKIPVCQLISHKFRFEEVNEAFETAINDQKSGAVKVLVRCNEGIQIPKC